MTKLYEEFIRDEVDNLEILKKELRGELTVVISEKRTIKNISLKLSESDKDIIRKIIDKLTVKEIVNFVSSNQNISKKEIYNYCLELKNEN